MNLRSMSTGVVVVFALTLSTTPAPGVVASSGLSVTPAAVSRSSSNPSVAVLAARKPAAVVSATYTTLPTGKVVVRVTSNASKVRIVYRTARNKKRTVTRKLKKGVAKLTLPVGSKSIRVRAKATTRLSPGPWVAATPPPVTPPPAARPVVDPTVAVPPVVDPPVVDPPVVDPTPPSSTDPVLASVGDIATSGNGTIDVANAIKAAKPDAVLMTGDYNQSTGTLSAILSTPDPYYGPKPSGLYPIIYPTAGPTHDIASCSDPLGYQQYWGRSPYDPYSFNLGAWHIISMPQPITRYGCSNQGAVQTWLQNDLATHPNICTLAYWHEPYFSPTTSGHPATTATKSWVDTLIAAHAELLVAGHQNGDFVAYTTPQTSGNANGTDANGIRAFVAATGSQTGYTISSGGNHNYSSSASGIWGFLKMTLHPAGWGWQFVRVGGATVSGPTSGSGTCH